METEINETPEVLNKDTDNAVEDDSKTDDKELTEQNIENNKTKTPKTIDEESKKTSEKNTESNKKTDQVSKENEEKENSSAVINENNEEKQEHSDISAENNGKKNGKPVAENEKNVLRKLLTENKHNYENEEANSFKRILEDDKQSKKDSVQNEIGSEQNGIAEFSDVNNKESSKEKANESFEKSPLKEHLVRTNGNDDSEQSDLEMDFDTNLLCPDVMMEVDESPVVTDNMDAINQGKSSPPLFDSLFSCIVDEMTGAEVDFNLSPEEEKIRLETYGTKKPVQFTRVHCTACNVHLGSALEGQSNRFVHPLLKVLICKGCYYFYTSGEFEKDEDGSELYCRWCGQGGQVLCCAKCEMVFCKKCIRINFCRRKLQEIKDSDDWMCFRCNPLQLVNLKIHAAEFMEYVRRETSRAATLENSASFMTTDYSQCCNAPKLESSGEPQPKKRKRKSSIDHDFNPYNPDNLPRTPIAPVRPPIVPARPILAPPPAPPLALPLRQENVRLVQRSIAFLPRSNDPRHGSVIRPQQLIASGGRVFRFGGTSFSRPRGEPQHQPQFFGSQQHGRSLLSAAAAAQQPVPNQPGYQMRFNPNTTAPMPRPPPPPRPHPHPPAPSPYAMPSISSSHPKSSGRRSIAPKPAHEWFDRTVRATARVNSNLSFTLTQLNRAQTEAHNVEDLAVVHNRLQEILSSTINSLIQIRKNLRSEFIEGIKNVKMAPPAKQRPNATLVAPPADDDVIFVNPEPDPKEKIRQSLPFVTLTSIKCAAPTPSTSSSTYTLADPRPGTSREPDAAENPRVFLRVKPLTSLQNAPADGGAALKVPPLMPISRERNGKVEKIVIVDDGPEPEMKSDAKVPETVVLDDDPEPEPEPESSGAKKDESVGKSEESVEKSEELVEKSDESVEKSEESVEKSEESVEKNKESVEKSEESVEKNKESVEKNEESVEKSGESVEKSGESVEKSGESVEKSGESVKKLVKLAKDKKSVGKSLKDGKLGNLSFRAELSNEEFGQVLNTKVVVKRSDEIDSLVKKKMKRESV